MIIDILSCIAVILFVAFFAQRFRMMDLYYVTILDEICFERHYEFFRAAEMGKIYFI